MRIESQRTIAIHLRSAIWNWIDVFPSEFNEAIRTKGKTEGAPERVFDLIHSLSHAGSENVFWPILTILNCISSDRISAEFQYRGKFTHTNRKVIISKFLHLLTMQIEALYDRNLGSLKTPLDISAIIRSSPRFLWLVRSIFVGLQRILTLKAMFLYGWWLLTSLTDRKSVV